MVNLGDYKTIKLGEKKLPKNKTDTVIKMYRKDKKMISLDDVKEILEELKAKNKKGDVQMLIQARHKGRMTTLKGYEENNIPDNNPDYYGNDVNIDDFTNYYYLEIHLRK